MDSASGAVTPLDPADFRRIPWKNGGGVTVDIAFEGDVWRFSRTPITAGGPFSDYTGFERLQVLIAGRGLVLQTPAGEIDVRRPFQPVRFAGETPVVSRLEAGPVEVVNLLGDRRRVRIDLTVLEPGRTQMLGPEVHIAYCPGSRTDLRFAGRDYVLETDEGLRIEGQSGPLACSRGVIVLGSVTNLNRT
jgi:environmental stress-induced protein Ves